MSATTRPPVSLCDAYWGEKLRIVKVTAPPSGSTRLKELGFCERAEIVKIAEGAALLCIVCGVRLAIGRDLGETILVQKSA